MKTQVICLLLCCFAAGSYGLVGSIPANTNCYWESLRRAFIFQPTWYPRCSGQYYQMEQCDVFRRCWCVRYQSGRPISEVYHTAGAVNCYYTQSVCKGNMVYYNCPSCNATCSDASNPAACQSSSCTPGCVCPPGLYLQNGQCVPAAQCRPVCSGGKVFSECGGCEQSCSQRNTPTVCTANCRRGCFCPTGTYLHGGQCLSDEQCTAALACTGNQIYSLCAGCDQTCENRNTLTRCTLQCRQQCTCPSGTYMHQGQCLTNSQCSVALACPSNQIYSLCAGCDQTCDQRGQLVACTTQCRQQCTCPNGMYLDGQTCVTAEQCPQVCDSSLNEVFSTCAAGCDATCDEPQKACSTIKICRRRCTCPVNHVRSEDNYCIPVETCPVVDIQEVTACSQQLVSLQNPLECDAVGDFATQQCNARECFCVQRHNGAELSGTRQPRAGYNINCQLYGNCPANMEFSTCATECPPTCNRRLPRCTRRCVLDCVCQNGMVRASSTNMTCVPESQCPVLSRCQAQRAGAGGNPQFPQCNPDGSYIPTQCDTNDNCYCVYENGTKIEGSDGNAGVLTMANYMACITARTCHNTPGMKFHPCAPPCDGMCAEPEPSCIFLESCTARCGCKTGYLLAADNQTCVQADACPSNEPACNHELGEIFSSCAASCDATCQSPRVACSLTKNCQQRCTCPPGHLRDSNNMCVAMGMCPPPPIVPVPSCNATLGEQWNTCASQCDPTCESPFAPCSLVLSCTARCACPSDKLRASDNHCVSVGVCRRRSAEGLSHCQRERQEKSDPMLMDAFIPDCDDTTGKYMLQQCYGFAGNFCWCVNPDNGTEIAGTRVPGFPLTTTLNCTAEASSQNSPPPLLAVAPPPPPST